MLTLDNLSADDRQFLMLLASRMSTQNNRSTANVLYVIQEDVEVPSCGYCDEYGDLKRTEEVDEGALCIECLELYENDEELPDQCNRCEDEAFYHYRVEQRFNLYEGSFFLTEEACQEHIDSNKHHYNNPKSYGISAWRNPEIVNLIDIIFKLTGTTKPNHYG